MIRKHAILLAVLFAAPDVQASGGSEAAPTHPKWKTECGSCHVAYPPKLLPAASWKAVMGGLDRHFGTDASLDAVSTKEILAFLENNASRRQPDPATKPLLRITETRWFRSEHDEVPARLWQDPRVKTPCNCSACHTQAESGNFNEHGIRLPK